MSGRTLYCLGEAWLELESPASLSSAEAFRPITTQAYSHYTCFQ